MKLAIVTFDWLKPGYRSKFGARSLNGLHRMLRTHLGIPFTFTAVVDRAIEGLHPGIDTLPLWDFGSTLPNPSWPKGPSCYRRLPVFNLSFAAQLGNPDRIVCIDQDVMPVGDMADIMSKPGDFLMWKTGNPNIPVCASMFAFSPSRDLQQRMVGDFSPGLAMGLTRNFMQGSDQGWMAYVMSSGIKSELSSVPGWGAAEGVHAFNDMPRLTVREWKPQLRSSRLGAGWLTRSVMLPYHSRLIMFTGKPDPWDEEAHDVAPWILHHAPEYRA